MTAPLTDELALEFANAGALFVLARVAHEHAMRNMRESADRLAWEITRAEAARAHAERAGEVLRAAVRLREDELRAKRGAW